MPLYLFDQQAIPNIDAPDFLFKGKTFDDIGRDPELTSYLRKRYDPDGTKYGGDVQRLKAAVLNTVAGWRGGALWESYLGLPNELPTSLMDHQDRNLLERLYLSAPGNYGKSAFYGYEVVNLRRRDEILRTKIGGPVAVGTAAALGIWFIRRRARLSRANDPQQAGKQPSRAGEVIGSLLVMAAGLALLLLLSRTGTHSGNGASGGRKAHERLDSVWENARR